MNNPLPLWWVGLFVITVLFGLAYLWAYPGLGSFAGQMGWSSQAEYEAEVALASQNLRPLYARFSAMQPQEMARDAQARALGERLFMNQCSQCHGSDAQGSKGFPNLTDSDWLHGGSPEKIKESITQGRVGSMPPMGAAAGSAEEARNLANYVLSLSASPHDVLRASLGRPKFMLCAACHGADGKGNQALGAPNLTDGVWLHGWGEDAILAIMKNGKVNHMPAFAEKLTPEQIQVLSAYVWSLSNQAATAK